MIGAVGSTLESLAMNEKRHSTIRAVLLFVYLNGVFEF